MRGTGGRFEDFLKDEGLLESCKAMAYKQIIIDELSKKLETENITKVKAAQMLHTSRAQLSTILDPDNNSITLSTLSKIAAFIGKELKIELIDSRVRHA